MNLFNKIKELFAFKRKEMKVNYNRVLPLNELLTDRWEKAQFLGFGKGTSIYDSAIVLGDVKVGENTWIGANATVRPRVSIGKNTIIGAGAVVVNDIPDNAVAVGVPAKIIRDNRR